MILGADDKTTGKVYYEGMILPSGDEFAGDYNSKVACCNYTNKNNITGGSYFFHFCLSSFLLC